MVAEHIRMAEAANSSEQWAFDFLIQNLPSNYTVFTGAHVKNQNGMSKDCDVIVIGDYAVYIVEIKGYTGNIAVTSAGWMNEDGRPLPGNPTEQVKNNQRVLAGKLRSIFRGKQDTPWVEGIVFVTGNEGKGVKLRFPQDQEPAYTADRIINALTNPRALPLRDEPQKLTPTLKDRIGESITSLVVARSVNQQVGDYKITSELGVQNGFKFTLAALNIGNLSQRYVLKQVELATLALAERNEKTALLFSEFEAVRACEGISGIPICNVPVQDGERVILPLRLQGKNLLAKQVDKLSAMEKVSILRLLAGTLGKIHARGVFWRNVTAKSVMLDKDNNPMIIDFSSAKILESGHTISSSLQNIPQWCAPEQQNNPTLCNAQTEIFSLAAMACSLLSQTPPTLEELWDGNYKVVLEDNLQNKFPKLGKVLMASVSLSSSERPSLVEFISAFSEIAELKNEHSALEPFVLQAGAIIDHRYELIEQLGKGGVASVWKANHLQGKFTCALKLFPANDNDLECARSEFSILCNAYHPNIIRTFDMGLIPNSEYGYISMEYAEDETLQDLTSSNGALFSQWFTQAISTLAYLHSIDVIHKDIKPGNICIKGDNIKLIDFNISGLDHWYVGTPQFKCPFMKPGDLWTPMADLWSLCATFYYLLADEPPKSFLINGVTTVELKKIQKPKEFSQQTFDKILSVLKEGVEELDSNDYDDFFGLSETKVVRLDALPKAICNKYGITNKTANGVAISLFYQERIHQIMQLIVYI